MSFYSPTSLLLFALALPITALYILKLRRRREPVSTLMFWEQIFREKQTTSLFQKLRRWLSLLLQLLFLALLTLALARPQFAFMTKAARQIILIVDNSASMNAVAGESSRLALARTRGLRLVDRLRHMDAMMVMSYHTQPVIYSPFTNHAKTLRQAVEAIPATDIRTNLEPALELAYAVAATQDHPEIILISDFQNASEAVLEELRSPPEGVTLHLWSVGTAHTDNVGITCFRVRRSLASAFDYQTLLTLTNASEEERQFNVELYVDDQLIDVRPYTLAPLASKTEIFSNFSFEGGRLKAALDVADEFATDNVAYAVLPRRKKLPVLLITPGNPFLESALRVDEKVELTVVSPGQYQSNSAQSTVTVLDRTQPAELPEGNLILIYPPADATAAWRIGRALDAPIITDWDRRHPILRYVHLDNVQIAAAYVVTPPSDAQVLVRSFEDPLVFVQETPERRIVFFAIDTLQSDLPLRVAFPVILANTLQWFQRESAAEGHFLNTGEVLKRTLPSPVIQDESGADQHPVSIMGPGGQSWELQPQDGTLIFEHTGRAGFYELQIGDETETWAVNLTDPSESSLSMAEGVESLLETEASNTSRSYWKASTLWRYPPWFYLVVLALLLSASEWYLYQRRKVE